MRKLSIAALLVVAVTSTLVLATSAIDAHSIRPLKRSIAAIRAQSGNAAAPLVVNCKPANAGGGGELQAALVTTRTMPGVPVTVQVTGQCFPPPGRDPANTPVLELNPDLDTRDPSSLITWIGQNQNALFVGGRQIGYEHWLPTTIPGASAPGLSVKLSSLGIKASDVGSYAAGSLGECEHIKRMELFINGQPAVTARVPKEASAFGPFHKWCNIDKVLPNNSSFTTKNCPGLAPLATAAAGLGNGTWAHGWWSYDWADSYVRVVKVTKVSASEYQVDTDPATPPVYGFKATARFYAVGGMRLLSQPGEYYIDVQQNDATLYLIPPAGFGSHSDAWLTHNRAPLLAQSKNSVSTVIGGHVFADFQFQYGLTSAVSLPGAANFSLQSITVTNFGGTCVSLEGSNVDVIGSTISNCGCKGLAIGGGDAATLTASGNGVTNNNIQAPGRVVRSYNPAVSYWGVGTSFTGNTLSNGGHAAFQGGGNNMVFAANIVKNFVWGCRDCGAIYFGRSWAKLGTTINGNIFTNIAKVEPTFLGSELVTAHYFDDQQSGVSVQSSTCDNVESCFLIGGGRNVFVQRSTCTNTKLCIHVDNRGMNWEKSMCAPNGIFAEQLKAVQWQTGVYANQYPYMINVWLQQPCVPFGNIIEYNTCLASSNCTTFMSANKSTVESWSTSNIIQYNSH